MLPERFFAKALTLCMCLLGTGAAIARDGPAGGPLNREKSGISEPRQTLQPVSAPLCLEIAAPIRTRLETNTTRLGPGLETTLVRRPSNSTSGQSPIKPTSTPSALTPAPLPDDPGTTAKLFSSYFRRTLRSSATGLSAAAAATATYKNTPRNAELQSVTRRMHSKVVIIGSGPAAHTAAIYLARAELKPVLYEGFMANGIAAGGQLTTTTEVENFPGFPEGIMGQELMDKMKQQSERFGTEIITETVAKVDLSSRPFKYATEWYPDVEHTADSIILATGASARRLGLPGEEKYWQNGISACAVCDGAVPIYRNKHLIVIGGGDSAAEEAMFLTKYGSHVTVLVRRDKLRASTIMAKRLLSHNKITVRFNTVGVEVKGDDKGLMSHMVVKDVVTGREEMLEANGLFYAIGHDPATGLVKGQIDTDEEGYVKTIPGTTQTNVPGVFAAGDVQDKRYRQAITSAGSGCMAALEAEKYLSEMHEVTEEHGPVKDGHL